MAGGVAICVVGPGVLVLAVTGVELNWLVAVRVKVG